MHDLTPITALGAQAPRSDTIGSITCSERPDIALASVAARLGTEEKTRNTLKKIIKTEAPEAGCFAGDNISAFWTGPDQWMLQAPFDNDEDLATKAKALLKSDASVVEQTDAWVRFDISGADIEQVMELLCNVDPRKLQTGKCARTSIHHLGSFVLRINDDVIAIYGPRASAGSLHHAIITAMETVS